jgi:hypothetical protein
MRSTAQSARFAIVGYSLAITFFLIVFLFLSQPLGMRFDFAREEHLRLIDIVLPTFLGYLGAASHFLFNANRGREVDRENASMLALLVHGPFLIFICAVAALFVSHYYSNRPLHIDDARIDALTFNQLSRYLSICLGVLAVSVGIISGYLFGPPPRTGARNAKKSTQTTDRISTAP